MRTTGNFWIKLLQPERRIHLRDTIEEMALVSAILYGGIAISALIALQFPLWPELTPEPIYIASIIGLAASIVFTLGRRRLPVWLMVTHLPFGLILVGIGLYAGSGTGSIIVSIVFILSSIYSFHFLTALPSIINSTMVLAIYVMVAIINSWQGWEAQAVFLLGGCLTAGLMVNVLVNRLNHLATRDNLTGLYNRHTWDMLLEQQLQAFSRDTLPISIMLLDLNDFKNVNDSQGHLAGDHILKQVASSILTTIRCDDFAARWGGDEFIIFLHNCNAQNAQLMEKRLNRKLKGIIGFSTGITQLQAEDDLDTLLSRADAMLYKHKKAKASLLTGC